MRLEKRSIKIIHSSKHYPQLSHPRYCTEKSIIYLHINGKKWDKYTYQFAHELCHYIIDKPSPESVGRFDWLEESLCELASFFCLKKMSQTWQINPPYSNWCDYAICLEKYPENQRPIRKDTKPFADWLEENIEELSKKRYMRDENAIIAWRLFSLFMSQPNHWKTIHYLKCIEVTNEMTLEDFLQEWQQVTPNYLKNLVNEISSKLHLKSIFPKNNDIKVALK